MRKQNFLWGSAILLGLTFAGCKVPAITEQTPRTSLPERYGSSNDSINIAALPWRSFFTDPNLVSLIDTALKNNQELLITLQEIEIAKNEVRLRQGAILPSVSAGVGIGVEKVGRYTSQGAGDASTQIKPGKEMPEALMDYTTAVSASWEVDVWRKLRNAKKAAIERFLATMEGKNFVLTNLIAEVANTYYELVALDNQLEIVRQSIALQENALEIVKVQKEAARTTELGVQKFAAEVAKSQGLEFDLLQQVKEAETRLNFLLARAPQPVPRSSTGFLSFTPSAVHMGLPSQLLANRPDIRQAEMELGAAKLDVKVARAEFLPSFGITARLGFQAFNPSYLVKFPESLLYSLAGDLAAPIINRNAIQAEFASANARQLQSLYNYERSILNAYLEVNTQVSRMENLGKRYEMKQKQVDALNQSISIAAELFKSARADYFEVLMTQRDALEAKLELVETKKDQVAAVINLYRGLGGGWQ